MTRLLAPAGASLAQAQDRLHASGFWLPRLLSDGAAAASSDRPAVTFTANAVAHTVGAWTEIVASLSEDVGWVKITQATPSTFTAATDTSTLFNLGVGAALSEEVRLDALGVGWFDAGSGALNSYDRWLFPIFIPRGSRVAGQIQGAVTLQQAGFRFEFFAPTHGLRPSTKIVALGASTAASRGVILTVPGGNNTEGAWTEIVASTDEPYVAFGISVQGGSDTTNTNGTALVDIAVGAAGSEVPIISDVYARPGSNETVVRSTLLHPASSGIIPRGSRLSARYQASTTASSLDVILHGIRPAA